MDMLAGGMDDVMQPAAFKLALVMRHTSSDIVIKLLRDLLSLHPQSVMYEQTYYYYKFNNTVYFFLVEVKLCR